MSANSTTGRTIWDDRARYVLLQAVMDVAPPTFDEWKLILDVVRAKGYDYTSKAALQHLQKLKKKEPGGPTSSAPSTPKGRKTAGSGPKSSGKRGRGAKAAAADPDQDQDDDFQESPTKKVKAELKSDETKNDIVKFEHDAEKDVDVV